MKRKKLAAKKIAIGSLEITGGGLIIMGGTLTGAAIGAGLGSAVPIIGTSTGAVLGAGMGASIAAPIATPIIKRGAKNIKEGMKILFADNHHTFFHSHHKLNSNQNLKEKQENDNIVPKVPV